MAPIPMQTISASMLLRRRHCLEEMASIRDSHCVNLLRLALAVREGQEATAVVAVGLEVVVVVAQVVQVAVVEPPWVVINSRRPSRAMPATAPAETTHLVCAAA